LLYSADPKNEFWHAICYIAQIRKMKIEK